MALKIGDFLSKYGPRALTVLGLIMEALPEAVELKEGLKEGRLDKQKALSLVEKKLRALGLFSSTVENHRESVLRWVSEGIDWAVGGINLAGGLGERIEFDPSPATDEGGGGAIRGGDEE